VWACPCARVKDRWNPVQASERADSRATKIWSDSLASIKLSAGLSWNWFSDYRLDFSEPNACGLASPRRSETKCLDCGQPYAYPEAKPIRMALSRFLQPPRSTNWTSATSSNGSSIPVPPLPLFFPPSHILQFRTQQVSTGSLSVRSEDPNCFNCSLWHSIQVGLD
jgi:hypothetical protein